LSVPLFNYVGTGLRVSIQRGWIVPEPRSVVVVRETEALNTGTTALFCHAKKKLFLDTSRSTGSFPSFRFISFHSIWFDLIWFHNNLKESNQRMKSNKTKVCPPKEPKSRIWCDFVASCIFMIDYFINLKNYDGKNVYHPK
jgi:hypothetical protein